MLNTTWAKAIKAAADPQQARHFYDLLAAASPGRKFNNCSLQQARIFATLFSGSKAASLALVSNPDWTKVLSPQNLAHPRSAESLRAEALTWIHALLESHGYSAALGGIRQFKSREMARIAARDLIRPGNAAEITR